jgi:hypothetical protein
MFDSLEFFRLRFAGRPLLIMLALIPIFVVMARRAGTGWPKRGSLVAGTGVGVTALVMYVAIAVYYATDPHYYDSAEPTMTAIGWLFEVGLPVHHALDTSQRYAHMYGPLAFIAQGFAMGLFGPSVAVSKWLGVSAALASLALLYKALRTRVTKERAVMLTGLCALLFLMFRNRTFWTRPEPLQLLCVSGSLCAAAIGPGVAAALLVGAGAGLLLNLKITGPLYMLPVVALLYARAGFQRTLLAGLAGAVVAGLPFGVFPNVDVAQYLVWVRLSADNGLLLAMLRQNIEWALFFLVPVLLSYYAHSSTDRPHSAEWRWLVCTLLVGVSGVVIAGSKPGAGVYHLIPFLPLVTYAIAMNLGTSQLTATSDRMVLPVGLAFLSAALIVALAEQSTFLHNLLGRRSVDEAADIRRFLDVHPRATTEMAACSDDQATLVRPILVFHNNAYFLDQPAVQEHQLSGLEVPPSTIQMLRACRVNFWLVPKGQEPFSGRNRYPSMRAKPLFSDAFRRAFYETYRLQNHTTYYDVWQCRAGVPS